MRSHEKWSRQDWWGCGWGGGSFGFNCLRSLANSLRLECGMTSTLTLLHSLSCSLSLCAIRRSSGSWEDCPSRRQCRSRPPLSQQPCRRHSPLLSSVTFVSGRPVWRSSHSLTLWMGVHVHVYVFVLICWCEWLCSPIVFPHLYSFCVPILNSFCVLSQKNFFFLCSLLFFFLFLIFSTHNSGTCPHLILVNTGGRTRQ